METTKDIRNFCDEEEEIPPLNSSTTPKFVPEVQYSQEKLEKQLSAITKQLTEISRQNLELVEQLMHLNNKNIQFLQKIDELNQTVVAHEQIEKRMHTELEKYKKDFYASIADPFINQMITMHISLLNDLKKADEDMQKMQGEDKNSAEIEKLQELRDMFKYYTDATEGCLINCGVEVFHPEIGEMTDYLRHSIIKTMISEDPNQHGLIAKICSCGYAYRGKVLRPAKVIAYKSK